MSAVERLGRDEAFVTTGAHAHLPILVPHGASVNDGAAGPCLLMEPTDAPTCHVTVRHPTLCQPLCHRMCAVHACSRKHRRADVSPYCASPYCAPAIVSPTTVPPNVRSNVPTKHDTNVLKELLGGHNNNRDNKK